MGSNIQANVLNKSLHDQFISSISEGHTYLFANFVVSPNQNLYRASTHPFKITFTPQTHVIAKTMNFPDYSYTFLTLSNILAVTEDTNVDHLIDVIALVKSIGCLEEYRKDSETKNRLRMVLTDLEDNDVECVLFDECASDAYMCQLQNINSPIVIVLNLARIAFSNEGKPQLSNSFNATRVSFNPAIIQVKHLLQSAKARTTPVLATFSDPIPKNLSQPSAGISFQSQNKITISEIIHQSVGDSFVIYCEVFKLETRHGWLYDGCSKCSTKPRLENAALFCGGCKKKPDAIEAKCKLHYIIKDESGSVSVIFWDKHAVQLIGKSAKEMKLKLQQEERAYDFPDELDHPIGKKMLLKLKINEYNKKYPSSSISVSQYTICEDLLDQFNVASVEVSQASKIEDKENIYPIASLDSQSTKELNTVVQLSSSVPSYANDKDNINIMDLTQDVPPPAVKGRRRTNVKRAVTTDEPTNHAKVAVKPPTDERLLKVIKQEK